MNNNGAKNFQQANDYNRRSSEHAPDQYMPIKALNQFSTDWVIKARVVKKGDIRNWKNARGEGKLINIDLVDREGTMIQGTAFNDVAERLDSELQQDQIYTFTNGQIKIANKKFTSIKNDYCITFEYSTQVEQCAEDTQIKGDAYSFTSLKGIEELVQQCTVDVIGVVLDVGPIGSLNMKDGTSCDKRTLTIGDE